LLIDPANELLSSPASYWEIAIKVSIGKYHVPGSFSVSQRGNPADHSLG
jgi:PIN domain nuclease of toxin-antitoxin system